MQLFQDQSTSFPALGPLYGVCQRAVGEPPNCCKAGSLVRPDAAGNTHVLWSGHDSFDSFLPVKMFGSMDSLCCSTSPIINYNVLFIYTERQWNTVDYMVKNYVWGLNLSIFIIHCLELWVGNCFFSVHSLFLYDETIKSSRLTWRQHLLANFYLQHQTHW